MRKFDEYTYTIPSWAAIAITNGGDSLTDKESEQLDTFLESLPAKGRGTFDFGDDEPEFCYYNDVDNLGNDCYKAIYTVFLD